MQGQGQHWQPGMTCKRKDLVFRQLMPSYSYSCRSGTQFNGSDKGEELESTIVGLALNGRVGVD